MILPSWGKPVAIGIGVLALIASTLFVVQRIYSKGEKAGAEGVLNKVQEETIREIDKAHKDKREADENTRTSPIDDILKRLR